MTKLKFHIKKSRFSVKSQFKEWKGADEGHSLNRDFTVLCITHMYVWTVKNAKMQKLSEFYNISLIFTMTLTAMEIRFPFFRTSVSFLQPAILLPS